MLWFESLVIIGDGVSFFLSFLFCEDAADVLFRDFLHPLLGPLHFVLGCEADFCSSFCGVTWVG